MIWVFFSSQDLESVLVYSETVVYTQHFNTEVLRVLLGTKVPPSVAGEATAGTGRCMQSLVIINRECLGLLLDWRQVRMPPLLRQKLGCEDAGLNWTILDLDHINVTAVTSVPTCRLCWERPLPDFIPSIVFCCVVLLMLSSHFWVFLWFRWLFLTLCFYLNRIWRVPTLQRKEVHWFWGGPFGDWGWNRSCYWLQQRDFPCAHQSPSLLSPWWVLVQWDQLF